MAAVGSKTIKYVLIVENDKGLRDGLQELLESQGYAVTWATNGQKALALLRSIADLPRVILLNLMMPVMDGFQFRAAQECDPRLGPIPVIVMTADRHVEVKRIKMGVNAYMKKPLDIDEVVRKIEPYFH